MGREQVRKERGFAPGKSYATLESMDIPVGHAEDEPVAGLIIGNARRLAGSVGKLKFCMLAYPIRRRLRYDDVTRVDVDDAPMSVHVVEDGQVAVAQERQFG